MPDSQQQKWELLNQQYLAHAKSLNKDHLVVSAVVTNFNKILVVRRAANDSYPGMWEFPGGGVDEDETVIQAIRRETKEETNLDLEEFPSAELMIHPTRTALRIVMLFECSNISAMALSHEHDEYYWLDIDSLSGKSDDEMVEKIYETMRSENQSIIELVVSLTSDTE